MKCECVYNVIGETCLALALRLELRAELLHLGARVSQHLLPRELRLRQLGALHAHLPLELCDALQRTFEYEYTLVQICTWYGYSPAHEGRQINIVYNLINGLVYSLIQ